MSERQRSVLRVVCKFHPDHVLAEWVSVHGHVLPWSLPTFTQERIGFPLDSQNVADSGNTPAHFKSVVRCDRPSCNYEMKFGPESMKALGQLASMVAATGQSAHTIDDLQRWFDDLAERRAEST